MSRNEAGSSIEAGEGDPLLQDADEAPNVAENNPQVANPQPAGEENRGQLLRGYLKQNKVKLCDHCTKTPGYHSLRQVGTDKDGNAVLYMCLGQDQAQRSPNPEHYIEGLRVHMDYVCDAAQRVGDDKNENTGVVWIIDMQGFWGDDVHAPSSLLPLARNPTIRKVCVLRAKADWMDACKKYTTYHEDIRGKVRSMSAVERDREFNNPEDERNEGLKDWLDKEIDSNKVMGRCFWAPPDGDGPQHDSRGSQHYIEKIESFFTSFNKNFPHPSIVQVFLDKEDSEKKNIKVPGKIIGDKSHKKTDCLDYKYYADELVDLLTGQDLPTGIAVGIYGNWGKGKTFILDMLSEKIKEKNRDCKQGRISWCQTTSQCSDCCKPYWVYLLIVGILFATITLVSSSLVISYGMRDLKNGNSSQSGNMTTVSPMLPQPIYAYIGFGAVGLVILVAIIVGLPKCRGTACCVCGELYKLLVLILCKRPPHPDKINGTLPERNLEVIELRFNAWEYAGSDFLWAAIVTNLCNVVETKFGYWKTRLFRVVEADASEKIEELVLAQDEPPAKGHTCTLEQDAASCYSVPLEHRPYDVLNVNLTSYYGFCLALVSIFIICIVVIVVYSVALGSFAPQVMASIVLGAAFVTQIKSAVLVVQSLFTSQADRISSLQQRMAGPDFSEELGFMHKVHMEVKLVQYMVKYMECLYQRRYRILLVIDDLDRVEQKKILKILEAVNILLSDPKSPFISIIAIDPRIVVKAIEQSFSQVLLDANINGHEYLKKIIQLPFCVPDVDDNRATQFLHDKIEAVKQKEGDADNALVLALKAYTHVPELLYPNPRNMTRICNILVLTMKLYQSQSSHREVGEICNLAWWVLLTEQWPYRMSLLMQVYEDECQQAKIEYRQVDKERDLLDVYKENEQKLSKPADWKSLLSLDYDPELFRQFLQNHRFTLRDLDKYLPYTFNLDLSLKTILALTLAERQIAGDDQNQFLAHLESSLSCLLPSVNRLLTSIQPPS